MRAAKALVSPNFGHELSTPSLLCVCEQQRIWWVIILVWAFIYIHTLRMRRLASVFASCWCVKLQDLSQCSIYLFLCFLRYRCTEIFSTWVKSIHFTFCPFTCAIFVWLCCVRTRYLIFKLFLYTVNTSLYIIVIVPVQYFKISLNWTLACIC